MKLRRLCFYRCVSVHRKVSASVPAGIPPPRVDIPRDQTPSGQTPREQTPPGADTPKVRHLPRSYPLEQTPNQEQTPPWSRHPPHKQTSPGADTPQEQTPPKIFLVLFFLFAFFFAFFAFFCFLLHFFAFYCIFLHFFYTPTPRYSTGDGHCCGRYVSYWNAFLLFLFHIRCGADDSTDATFR